MNDLKPFSKDRQPKNRRSRKRIPNRATTFKKLLEVKTTVADPSERGQRVKVTLYEAMALGQIKAAIKGNTRAFQEIQDTLFGKIKERAASCPATCASTSHRPKT